MSSDVDGSGLIVTMTDIALAGYCPSGARSWFGRKELDFRGFLKNGIAAEDLLATGDAMAINTVERKIEREWLDGDPSDLVLTIDDVRESRKCAAGVRGWALRNGLDYNRFLERGISARELLATHDRHALRMIRDKLERSRG